MQFTRTERKTAGGGVLSPASPVRHQFVTLDGLRGIAALAVALYHAPFLWPAGSPKGFLHESYLAVDFFFALSGFVLAHAYTQRLTAGMTIRQFMTARLIRLYPLYLLAFLLSLVVALARLHAHKVGLGEFFGNVLSGLLFLPSPFSDSDLFPMNLPAWSLFFELVANLVFALLGRRMSTGLAAVIVAGSAALMLATVPAGWFGFGEANGPLDAGHAWTSFLGGLTRVSFAFFAGVLIERAKRSSFFTAPSWLLVIALCLVLSAAPGKPFAVVFDLVAVLVIFPAIVYLGTLTQAPARARRAFSLLGDASYAVYVLQFPLYGLLPPVFALLFRAKQSEVSLAFGLASVVIVMMVALITDTILDRPMRQWLTRFFSRSPHN